MVTTSAAAGNAVDALLSTNPVVEAERAFATGDRRHIVVPVCGDHGGEVIPGWPVEQERPGMWAALEKGRRPITCKDLGRDSRSRNFRRVARYAEQYNRRLIELENSERK